MMRSAVPWQVKRAVAGLVVLALGAGCVGRGARPDSSLHEGQEVRDTRLGYRLVVPPEDGFLAGSPRDPAVVRAGDGTLVRVFPEHFAEPPSMEACWERLVARLPDDLPDAPRDAGELAARADEGFTRPSGSRLFFKPYPRDTACLILVIEGPSDSPVLARTAELGMASFRAVELDSPSRVAFGLDAGMQLLEMNENAGALARFEEVLPLAPDNLRANLGAGLAAFFTGGDAVARSIEYLERAFALREDASREGGRESLLFDQRFMRDALMHLGLAYATVKDYERAKVRLSELVTRFPEDPVGLYNLACVLALTGEKDEAFHYLNASLRREPSLAEHALTDDDLLGLHARPEWQHIIETASGSSGTHAGRGED